MKTLKKTWCQPLATFYFTTGKSLFSFVTHKSRHIIARISNLHYESLHRATRQAEGYIWKFSFWKTRICIRGVFLIIYFKYVVAVTSQRILAKCRISQLKYAGGFNTLALDTFTYLYCCLGSKSQLIWRSRKVVDTRPICIFSIKLFVYSCSL